MAQETAAQKKARLASEKPDEQAATAGNAGAEVTGDAAGLMKFLNPDAAAQAPVQAAAQTEPGKTDTEDGGEDGTVADESATETETQAIVVPVDPEKTGPRSYEVIVDSIGLGTAQVALRGEHILLDTSLAQRLLSLKAVRAV